MRERQLAKTPATIRYNASVLSMTIVERRPLEVHWFLPTSGDGRSVVGFHPDPEKRSPGDARAADVDYLSLVARAADRMGFAGALMPTGAQCEDTWLMAAALSRETELLRFLVAFRPGFVLPTLAAQQAATLQRISRGRVLINIVSGGDPAEQRAYGDFLDHDARYDRTDEFLTIARKCWEREPFDFEGTYYRVEKGGLQRLLAEDIGEDRLDGRPLAPPIYFGGASPAAEAVAARHADVYLLWGEPLEWVRERVERMRALAAQHGRSMRFGIRFHLIARGREGDAWAEAESLLAKMEPDQIERVQKRLAAMDSVGQQRMTGLANGRIDMESLTIAPNLWSGVGLVRHGAGTALVGSYEQVADRIREYADIGLDTFILSAYPHLEEAYWVGETLLPLVRDLTAEITVPTRVTA